MQILTAVELKEFQETHSDCKPKDKCFECKILKALERCHVVLRDAAFNENYDADDAIQALVDTGGEMSDGKD